MSLDVSSEPTNSGTPETSRVQRFIRICAKCREAKPIEEFGEHFHTNRTTGVRVFHGWTDNCRACMARPTKRGNH